MSDRPGSVEELLDRITPEVHQELRTAIELGHWSNGVKLTSEQRQNSLQLIIAWEAEHLPVEERTGFIDRTDLRKEHCDD